MILETPFGTFKGSNKDISDVSQLHDNLIILSFLAQFTTLRRKAPSFSYGGYKARPPNLRK